MTTPKHSPLPFSVTSGFHPLTLVAEGGFVNDANGEQVAFFKKEQDAKLFSCACNNHYKLLKECKTALEILEHIEGEYNIVSGHIKNLEKAIAEGES